MDKNRKENTPNIKQVYGSGVIGYKVEFSISDLYALRALADDVIFETKGDNCFATALANTIIKLCVNTIGVPAENKWDFLSNSSAE